MAESLFDTVYSGYSTPLQAQLTRADTAYKQILTQTAQQELVNKKAEQNALQSIWGPGGALAATNAVANPQDADAQRLAATARLMFSLGDTTKGDQIMNSMSMANERQIQSRKAQVEEIQHRNQTIGGIFGAVDSQETYSAALPQLQESGVDIAKLGLSGDYTRDADKLRYLAKSTLTSNQQITLGERQQKLDQDSAYRDARLGQIDTALARQQRQYQLQVQAEDRRSAEFHHREHEDSLKDARAQEGLGFKTLKDTDRQYANVSKPQKVEIDAASSVFATDDRTMNIPENLRNGLSKMAVLRTKRKLADQLRGAAAGSTYEQEDFDSALEQTMQEMEQEGLFKPSKLGGGGLFGTGDPEYKHVPPPAPRKGTPSQGPATPPPTAVAAYSSPQEVAAAMRSGKLTYDQAAQILKQKGWAK